MKWENKGHELEDIAEQICSLSKKPFYIWGYGTFGKAFFESFREKLNLIGFVDSNSKKWQEARDGIVGVYDPHILKNTEAIILVSTGWTREVFSKLNQMGFKRNINYFHIDDFASVYMWFMEKKIYLSDIVYQITEKCTLRCKKCNAFVPYIQNPQNIELSQIKHDFERFFQWCDCVNVVQLAGGDAMVHPAFAEILIYLGENYFGNKINNIEVYSNAVMIPDINTLELMRKYKVYYRFTDYLPYTQGRQKIQEIVTLLDQYEIRYDHAKFEQWGDCGYPQESNGIKGEKSLREFFEACDRRSCHQLSHLGVLFCGMALAADRIGYCHLDSSDVYPIEHYDENKRTEFLEFMLGYSEKGYLEYCKKCNGGQNVNSAFIEAGEQL